MFSSACYAGIVWSPGGEAPVITKGSKSFTRWARTWPLWVLNKRTLSLLTTEICMGHPIVRYDIYVVYEKHGSSIYCTSDTRLSIYLRKATRGYLIHFSHLIFSFTTRKKGTRIIQGVHIAFYWNAAFLKAYTRIFTV